MPDKPTDNKLTFVKWYAEKKGLKIKDCKIILKNYVNAVINGSHNKDCNSKFYPCHLCLLGNWLSEYHKYFKQNN